MKRAPLRSSLFNLLFITINALACVVCLPALLLPRKHFPAFVELYLKTLTALERTVLGLDYEVRGQENLPPEGPFLVAAKHYSLYETFKIHLLLKDPAIILKKELLKIPLWGAYLKKSGVIAIDRSTPQTALKSIENGALRIKEQGRPILIFPQGTRVALDDDTNRKPYKAGIARIQEVTNLPVIPLALNSGLFWPRNSWLKSPGKVIFEFLPPIPPGHSKKELMAMIEEQLESKSRTLVNESKAAAAKKRRGALWFAAAALLAFGAYSILWFKTAESVKAAYLDWMRGAGGPERSYKEPAVSGYPGRLTLHVEDEYLQTSEGTLKVESLEAKSWPFPGAPIHVTASGLAILNYKWAEPLRFDGLNAVFTSSGDTLDVKESALYLREFMAQANGHIDFSQKPFPKLDMAVTLKNHKILLSRLVKIKAVESRVALFTEAGLNMLAGEDGRVQVPLIQKGQTLYAGPLPVASLPDVPRPAPGNPPAPHQ